MTRYALCPDDCDTRFEVSEEDSHTTLDEIVGHLQGEPHNRSQEAAMALLPTLEVIEDA